MLRFIGLWIALSFTGIAAAAEPVVPAVSVDFGTVIRIPGQPPQIDPNNHFVLSADGRAPAIFARVQRGAAEDYRLSYEVFRRDAGENRYVRIEQSETWGIRAASARQGGVLIGPDFPGGAVPGLYRFDVFVNDTWEQSVEFSIESPAP